MKGGEIVLGRNCRPGRSLEEELSFNRREGFAFLQLWYDEKGFSHTERDGDDPLIYKDKPVIIHALIDKGRYPEFARRLLPIMEALGHKELIIHPVCHSEEIISSTADEVIDEINRIEPEFLLDLAHIDFKRIFTGPLSDYSGPLILELAHGDDELRDSRDRHRDLLA